MEQAEKNLDILSNFMKTPWILFHNQKRGHVWSKGDVWSPCIWFTVGRWLLAMWQKQSVCIILVNNIFNNLFGCHVNFVNHILWFFTPNDFLYYKLYWFTSRLVLEKTEKWSLAQTVEDVTKVPTQEVVNTLHAALWKPAAHPSN